ncbi:hypothetical protein COL01_11615 [Bacillus thuringiensis]|uniref:DUF6572 domain-containing protein n=1 Tax=Bacillus thuringiensis TaxID=1428 RepID=UPI000BF6CBE1|nr:DUF6572 domain-containing protein [Bacillus thuringiensis]PFN53314.1 hypothetical protein COJ75_23145 [Bacillus thuringiensis]PFV34448.1 hypothetical protein COL01_11615 [Bacillus thuringiensis]
MALHPKNKIDILSIDIKCNDTINVSIFDELDWNDQEKHASLLLKKIKECVTFVESKEIYKKIPGIVGKSKFVIQIFTKFECSEFGNDFYEIVEDLLLDKGYELKVY